MIPRGHVAALVQMRIDGFHPCTSRSSTHSLAVHPPLTRLAKLHIVSGTLHENPRRHERSGLCPVHSQSITRHIEIHQGRYILPLAQCEPDPPGAPRPARATHRAEPSSETLGTWPYGHVQSYKLTRSQRVEMTSTSSHLSDANSQRRASDPDSSRTASDIASGRTTSLRWFNVAPGRDGTFAILRLFAG